MKYRIQIVLAVTAFLIIGLGKSDIAAQGYEPFTELNAAGNTYTSSPTTFTGNNGHQWTHYRSRLVSSNQSDAITGTTLGFDNSGDGYIQSGSIPGGLSSITFQWRSYFTGGSASNRTVRVRVNGNIVGTFTLDKMGTTEVHTISGLQYTGNVVIRFESIGNRQIVIDDVIWSGSGGSVYQESIFPDLYGEDLLDALAGNYKTSTTYSYNNARDIMFGYIYNDNGIVTCIYTAQEIYIDPNSSTPRTDAYQNYYFSTEHIWPQSLGASSGNAHSDMHHLQPIYQSVNASRANHPFAYLEDSEVTRWWRLNHSQTNIPNNYPGEWSKTKSSPSPGFFEVRDDSKGRTARSMFYFYTMYKAEADAADPNYFDIQSQALRNYHNDDTVDNIEILRNFLIAEIQDGKVNPFILDTTLVTRAYFDGVGGASYVESMGNVSSTTSVSAHNSNGGFDNDWTFSGNADVRSTLSSSGYSDASGDANIFFGTAGGVNNRNLTISGIDSRGLGNATISFGMNSTSGQGLTVSYSTNGSTFHTLNYTVPSNGGWKRVTFDTSLPQVENLTIRFSKNDGNNYRLDDLEIYPTPQFELVGSDSGFDEFQDEISSTFVLNGNYPNPFNPVTQISYELSEQSHVLLHVYDITGRLVATLVNESQQVGSHAVAFDASDLPSGMYLYRLNANHQSANGKMLLIK